MGGGRNDGKEKPEHLVECPGRDADAMMYSRGYGDTANKTPCMCKVGKKDAPVYIHGNC